MSIAGCMSPATVYCSLIACDVDTTSATNGGDTAECGMYEESSVKLGPHVDTHNS